MLSRRSFLAATLSLLIQPSGAIAKKKPVEIKKFGPHTLAREQWPPAIAPDFISIVDKGYALLSDQTGRLAIVDLKRESGPVVVGELFGIGRKIVDLAVTQHRVYAIVYQETGTEQSFALVVISITPANEPTIMSKTPIPYLAEPTAIAASGDIVAVGGAGANGENQVLLLNMSTKKRSDEGNVPLATLNVEQAITKIDFQEKQLIVLQPGARLTVIDMFNVGNVRDPQKAAHLKLDGNYNVMNRSKDMLVLAGQSNDHKLETRLITLKPAPKMVARVPLPMGETLDAALQKTQILLLGNQGGRLAVLPIAINKNFELAVGQAVVLPGGTHGNGSKARIAARERELYVASDNGTVQVLDINKGGWQYLYSHTIPRLPVASVAIGGNRAILAGADIKVYDITQPDHPALLCSAESPSPVRAIAIAGERFLALTRDGLNLRPIDKPSDVVASVKLSGQSLSYDAADKTAYVMGVQGKNSVVTPVKVNGGLTAGTAQTLTGIFQHASAGNGKVLVSGLNKLALFDMSNGSQIGSREFPNLAIRDMRLLGDVAYIAALDASSKGFLLTINTTKSELPTIGSVDLPQDAVALAVNGAQAVVVGRAAEGGDKASLVDLSNAAAPRVVATFPVLEAASAVAIQDKLALVGGRGMEILNLS